MPLSGIKVLDLCRARAGPTAVRQLADWGADIIKIERPPSLGKETLGGERDGFDFQNLHRNKRSLTLDLKQPEGREVFMRLASKADVVVENFRPGVKHRLGIDYETLSQGNPRLVYGSISGFGQQGAYASRPGLDQIAQGMSGFMSVTGLPGQGPVRAGIPIADLCAGFNLALGIMIALFARERTGKGKWVHTSLLEANLTMMDFQAARYLLSGEVPGQAGNNHPTSIPTGVFKTSDGQVNVQAASDHLFERLCKALDADALLEDSLYATMDSRSEHRDALHEAIGRYTVKLTSQQLIDLLATVGVPCGPIYTMDQTFGDSHVESLNMTPQFEHPRLGRQRLLGQAINFSDAAETVHSATPDLGQHTDEILREAGYDDAAIDGLRSASIV